MKKKYEPENIYIWMLDLEELHEQELLYMYQQLPQFRKEKADRIKSTEKRNQSIGAGFLLVKLQQLLCSTYGFCMEKLNIIYSEDGKPYFEREIGVVFSISHTLGCVALAFEIQIFPQGEITGFKSDQLGIDIEYIKNAPLKVANRFFHKKEREYILQIEESRVAYAFYRIWTMKEAWVKMTGVGIGMALSSFSVLDKGELFWDGIIDKRERQYAISICRIKPCTGYEPFISWVNCDII